MDKRYLNNIFSAKKRTYLALANAGVNIGAQSVTGKSVFPVILLEVSTDGGKRKLRRIASVLFANRETSRFLKSLVDLLGGWNKVVDLFNEQGYILQLIPLSKGYTYAVYPLAKFVEENFQRKLTDDGKKRILEYEPALEELEVFNGEEILRWYDKLAYERGWLNDRQKEEYRRRYAVAEEQPGEDLVVDENDDDWF